MTTKLTYEYLQNHLSENKEHYLEAGKLLSDAIIRDAIDYVKKNGAAEKIIFSPQIELTANDEKGCTTVTYTRSDGSTLSYHRPT